MKKLVSAVALSIAVLSLSACGKTDSPDAAASADTADMPAEEAVNSAEANAQPVPDSAASEDVGGKTTQNEKDEAAKLANDFNAMDGEDKADGAKKAN